MKTARCASQRCKNGSTPARAPYGWLVASPIRLADWSCTEQGGKKRCSGPSCAQSCSNSPLCFNWERANGSEHTDTTEKRRRVGGRLSCKVIPALIGGPRQGHSPQKVILSAYLVPSRPTCTAQTRPPPTHSGAPRDTAGRDRSSRPPWARPALSTTESHCRRKGGLP